MKLSIKKLLFLFCILLLSGQVYSATVSSYGGVSTQTMYNPINRTGNTIRIQQTIIPGTNPVTNYSSISSRAHNMTPSVKFTSVPAPGYAPPQSNTVTHSTVYTSTTPAGIYIQNNPPIIRYPVNNTYYYGNNNYYNNGYYTNKVQYPIVTKTTTMTNGNGTYTYSEDYIPSVHGTTYTNGRRFLAW